MDRHTCSFVLNVLYEVGGVIATHIHRVAAKHTIAPKFIQEGAIRSCVGSRLLRGSSALPQLLLCKNLVRAPVQIESSI
jgi:hypothetical protein